MGTKNRRVATYLPPELDDRLKSFIVEQNLKGESAALIAILSEFFGVTHSEAHGIDYSSFVRLEQFQGFADTLSQLSDRVDASELNGELLSRLLNRVEQLESRIDSLNSHVVVSKTPLTVTDVSPGQMDLLAVVDQDLTEESLQGEPKSELANILVPLTGAQLAERLGVDKGAPSKEKKRMAHDRFVEWTKRKDPDGVGWQYEPTSKRYVPLS